MTNEIWTYRDLLNHSIVAAKALHGAGLKKDDVIAVISENRHEFPAAAFGAFYLNAIVAPINVTYTERKSRPAIISQSLSISFRKKLFFLLIL